MYNLILVIIFSILSSCSNGKSNDANFKIKEEKLSVSSASKNVLFRTSKAILFSNELKLDTFLLEAKGKTLLESIIFFKIINSQNDVIYYRQFRSEDIIGYDFTLPNENADSIALTMTDERKQILIKNKLENFFDLKNFKTPAIPTNLSYDTDTPSLFEICNLEVHIVGFAIRQHTKFFCLNEPRLFEICNLEIHIVGFVIRKQTSIFV